MAQTNGTGIDRDTANHIRMRQAVQDAVNAVVSSTFDVMVRNSVHVSNMDELKLMSLQTSTKMSKEFTKVLSKSLNDQSDKLAKAILLAFKNLPEIPPFPKFPDIPTPPDSVSVNNLSGVIRALKDLQEQLKQKDFSPIIQAPNVNVPESSVNLDLDPVSKQVKRMVTGLTKLEKMAAASNKTLAKEMTKMLDGFGRQVVSVSGGGDGLTKAQLTSVTGTPKTLTSSSLALTSATVAVQVNSASTNIAWVDVSAVGKPIAVGGSNVVVDLATPANSIGNIIYPAQNPFRMEFKTLSDLYAAGPTGSTISYTYYER